MLLSSGDWRAVALLALALAAQPSRAEQPAAVERAHLLLGDLDLASELCRRIVLAALRSGDEDEAREALATYVAGVKPGGGPFAVELASAAAAVAERNGAPAFAAALMSSASGHLPAPALEEHLLRTAELYVAAGDSVRARVVLDFLRARDASPAPRGPRWAALLRDVARLRARSRVHERGRGNAARPAPDPEPSAGASAAPELVAAARALERSRAARHSQEEGVE